MPRILKLPSNKMDIREFATLCDVASATAYAWRAKGLLAGIEAGKIQGRLCLGRKEALAWIKLNIAEKESA